jgi:hypothetical protein
MLAQVCKRVCVHSVVQWETTILVKEPAGLIELLQGKISALAVSFEQVAHDSFLPPILGWSRRPRRT